MRHIKLFFCCLLFATSVVCVSAQNGLNAPYSQYGIGMGRMPYNMPFAASLGGVAYTRAGNNFVNPFNPASYAAIEKESFVFDMGFVFDMSTLTDPSASQYDADGNLGYLAIAFPLTKWWKTAVGMLPMTDVNYLSSKVDALPFGSVKTRYEGNGGVSRLFWGHAFNLSQRLSLGFNANFLYGFIDRGITYDFSTSDSATFYMDSRRQKSSTLKNFLFDLGVQYRHPLPHNYELGLGLSAVTPQTLRVWDKALVYTFVTYSAMEYMRDTIFPAAGEDSEYESTMEQPLQLGLGVSLNNNRWLVAVDASYAPWSGLRYDDRNHIFGNTAVRYGDNLKGALGFQLLGDRGATRYFRRITYSAGVHYECGKLRLQLADQTQHRLDEWGFGLGATLPMRKGRSLLNISASYGSMGSDDLLRHNCLTIGFSVSSCESWFVKRKYN